MSTRKPVDRRARAQRKQDLLLASQVLRGQAGLALGAIGDRVDRVVDRARRVRNFLMRPAVLYTAGVGLMVALLRPRRRPRAVVAPAATAAGRRSAVRPRRRGGLLRYAFLGWRLWRDFGPIVKQQLRAARRDASRRG